MTKTIVVGALALVLLGGCSREPEAVPEATNMSEVVEAPVETPEPAPVPVETPSGIEAPAPVAPPRAAEIAPDVQMQDDADATGMTARVTRDEAPPENPVENQFEPQ